MAWAVRRVTGPARGVAGTGVTIAAAILLAACGSDGDPADTPTPGVTTTIDTVDGTVHVTNSGPPPGMAAHPGHVDRT